MVRFFAGLLVGGFCGVLIMALCAAAKGRTEEEEQSYRQRYEALMALPNCNDCEGVKDCPFRPDWGGTARINCPLHTAEASHD